MKHRLRTEEARKKYEEYIASRVPSTQCALCAKEPIQAFTHWKIVPNNFPYDRIAEMHNMIVPIRHCVEEELTQEELTEYASIKKSILQEYDFLMEATTKVKSIPEHFHIHLLNIKVLS